MPVEVEILAEAGMGAETGVFSRKGDVMISNERPSPFGGRPYQGQPRPPSNEDTLKSETLQVERKTFVITLKENPRGRFLRITEDVGGRRDTIIIPSTGLEDFQKLLGEMVKVSNEIPPKTPAP